MSPSQETRANRQGTSLVSLILLEAVLVMGLVRPFPSMSSRFRVGLGLACGLAAILIVLELLPPSRAVSIAKWLVGLVTLAGAEAVFVRAGWFGGGSRAQLATMRGYSIIAGAILVLSCGLLWRKLRTHPSPPAAARVGAEYVVGLDARARLRGLAIVLGVASCAGWFGWFNPEVQREDAVGFQIVTAFFGLVLVLGLYRLLRGPRPILRATRSGVWLWIGARRHFVPWYAIARFTIAPNPTLEGRPALVIGFRQVPAALEPRMGSAVWMSEGLLLPTTSVLPGPLEPHVAALNALLGRAQAA